MSDETLRWVCGWLLLDSPFVICVSPVSSARSPSEGPVVCQAQLWTLGGSAQGPATLHSSLNSARHQSARLCVLVCTLCAPCVYVGSCSKNSVAEIILWVGRRPWRRKAAPARENDNAGVPGPSSWGVHGGPAFFNRPGNRSRFRIRRHHGTRLTPDRAYSWTSYGERLNGGHLTAIVPQHKLGRACA